MRILYFYIFSGSSLFCSVCSFFLNLYFWFLHCFFNLRWLFFFPWIYLLGHGRSQVPQDRILFSFDLLSFPASSGLFLRKLLKLAPMIGSGLFPSPELGFGALTGPPHNFWGSFSNAWFKIRYRYSKKRNSL